MRRRFFVPTVFFCLAILLLWNYQTVSFTRVLTDIAEYWYEWHSIFYKYSSTNFYTENYSWYWIFLIVDSIVYVVIDRSRHYKFYGSTLAILNPFLFSSFFSILRLVILIYTHFFISVRQSFALWNFLFFCSFFFTVLFFSLLRFLLYKHAHEI